MAASGAALGQRRNVEAAVLQRHTKDECSHSSSSIWHSWQVFLCSYNNAIMGWGKKKRAARNRREETEQKTNRHALT